LRSAGCIDVPTRGYEQNQSILAWRRRTRNGHTRLGHRDTGDVAEATLGTANRAPRLVFARRRYRLPSMLYATVCEGVATAVSVDEGTGSPAQDNVGGTGSLPAGTATGPGPTRLRKLLDKEHRLVDEGRELLDEEVRELREVERRAADRLQISSTARIWSRLTAVDFMNSSMQFAALALLCLFSVLDHRGCRDWRRRATAPDPASGP
jgi:hypothetical protein